MFSLDFFVFLAQVTQKVKDAVSVIWEISAVLATKASLIMIVRS
jgi:hypothetical protein